MWTWLKSIWTDEAKFTRGLRGLMLGIAMAATTSAGAKLVEGDLSKIDGGDWARFGVAVVLGSLGGATGAGTKPAEPKA